MVHLSHNLNIWAHFLEGLQKVLNIARARGNAAERNRVGTVAIRTDTLTNAGLRSP